MHWKIFCEIRSDGGAEGIVEICFQHLIDNAAVCFFKFLRITSCHQTFLRCYSSESQHVQVILRYFFCLFTQFPDALYDQPLYVRLCTELKGVIARTSSHKAVPSSPFSFPVDAISTIFTILQERCMDSLFWSVFGLDSTERVTRTKDLSLIKLMQESARFSSVSQLSFFTLRLRLRLIASIQDTRVWNRLGSHRPPFLQTLSLKRLETVCLASPGRISDNNYLLTILRYYHSINLEPAWRKIICLRISNG